MSRLKKCIFILICIYSSIILTFTYEISTTTEIGNKIWQNECSSSKNLLVFWNQREAFPSLGIGHFIWYPPHIKKEYTEQFPALCAFLLQHHVTLPTWIQEALNKGAPWQSREEFLKDHQRTYELKELLFRTIPLQAQYIIETFLSEWPKIIDAVPRKYKKVVAKKYELLKKTDNGLYALIDYTNFKGTGLNLKERINGKGWGLLQVLMHMPENLSKETAPRSFALTAAHLLIERMQSDTPSYQSANFLSGWMKRLNSYYL